MTVTVLRLGANNGGTGLLRVRDRIEASRALVFGGPLLDPSDDFAPSILASMFYALKKLPISVVCAGILVIILVAHGSPDSLGCKTSIEGRCYKVAFSRLFALSEILKQVGNSFTGEGSVIPLFF